MKIKKLLELATSLVKELNKITNIGEHWTESNQAYQQLLDYAKTNKLTSYEVEKAWRYANHMTHLA